MPNLEKLRWSPCDSQNLANELFLQATQLGPAQLSALRQKLNFNDADQIKISLKNFFVVHFQEYQLSIAYINGKDRYGKMCLTGFHYYSILRIIQSILINPGKANLLSLDFQYERFRDVVKYSSLRAAVKDRLSDISGEG